MPVHRLIAGRMPGRPLTYVLLRGLRPPEITDKWIAEADLYRGKKLVRRGRPAGSGKKTQTTLRISKEVLEFFRATGCRRLRLPPEI